MVFDYYYRLSRSHQALYRRSDRTGRIELPHPGTLQRHVRALQAALESEHLAATRRATAGLVNAIVRDLAVAPLQSRVLGARPSHDWGELQGLYEPAESGRPARITVWMRTARNRRVVAFRSYLRTVLHELCHHLDYELLDLDESFHTEGFFQRESSLFHQLLDT